MLGFAGTHVRNAATVGGNLVLARVRRLESDLATVLMGAGATVQFVPLHSCADASTSKCGSWLLPLLMIRRSGSLHVQCELQCCQNQELHSCQQRSHWKLSSSHLYVRCVTTCYMVICCTLQECIG